MKIYHKFLLYQNKLLKPYVRILLGLVEALTYLASLLLIVGVIYEHGFPLSVDEVAKIQVLYKAVWIIFLVDVTLHISLEYRSTKKQYRRLAWILSLRRARATERLASCVLRLSRCERASRKKTDHVATFLESFASYK